MVCVVSVIVKRPVLPLCVVDGRSRNPLYYYYYKSNIKDIGTNSQHQTKIFTVWLEPLKTPAGFRT